MYDQTASPLSFGLCSRCSNKVFGHAVYINGILFCAYCELDLVLTVNQKPKDHKKWWLKDG